MAILDGRWWGQWWPWLLLWFAAAALVATAVFLVVRALRAGRPLPHTHGSVFYLDEKYIMKLYKMYGGKYRAALSQEVEERTADSRETEVAVEGGPGRVTAKRGKQDEIFRRWVETTEAITIFRIVMDVLESAGDIVHVDLRTGTVLGDHALSAALDKADSRVPGKVAISQIDAFVSVRGIFTVKDMADKTTTLAAEHLRFKCVTEYMEEPEGLTGAFPARCLARPQQMSADGFVELRPIAIFR